MSRHSYVASTGRLVRARRRRHSTERMLAMGDAAWWVSYRRTAMTLDTRMKALFRAIDAG